MRARVAVAWPLAKRLNPLGSWEKIKDHNQEPVDIVIPVLPKDLDVLPLVVQGVRENFQHPIGGVYIVAPESAALRDFCSATDCNFVDERAVPCATPDKIRYNFKGRDRSKWIYQQLLKLSGAVGSSKWYFITDADTVLIRPHVFRCGNRHIFYQLPVIHLPYRYAYHRLLGKKATQALTFVSHMMMFSRERVHQLHGMIESRHSKRWDEAIISIIDQDELSCFADYETYGTFIQQSEGAITFPFYNMEFKRDSLAPFSDLKKRYSADTGTLSFHAWLNDR